MHPPGPAVEVSVAELALLELVEQLVLVDVQVHREQPGAEQCERVAGLEVRGAAAVAGITLAHDPLDDLQDARWIGAGGCVAVAERADRERHRGVRPLGAAALLAVR